MSCSVSKLKRQDHLVNIVVNARKCVRNKINGEFDKFTRVQVGNILGLITAHSAFVRNRGRHSTAKVPFADWNKAFMKTIPTDMDDAFEGLRNEISNTLRTDVFQAISDVIKSMDTQLRGDPAAMISGALKIFLLNLQGRQEEVNKEVEHMTNVLQKNFKNISFQAVTDGDDHFFTSAMAEIYDDAFKVQATKAVRATRNSPGVKAKTKHVVRCEFLEAEISAPDGPYFRILEDCRTMYRSFLDRERERLAVKIDDIFRKIQFDFMSICKIKDDNSPEGIKFRELMFSLVEPSRAILNGPVKNGLTLAKQYK